MCWCCWSLSIRPFGSRSFLLCFDSSFWSAETCHSFGFLECDDSSSLCISGQREYRTSFCFGSSLEKESDDKSSHSKTSTRRQVIRSPGRPRNNLLSQSRFGVVARGDVLAGMRNPNLVQSRLNAADHPQVLGEQLRIDLEDAAIGARNPAGRLHSVAQERFRFQLHLRPRQHLAVEHHVAIKGRDPRFAFAPEADPRGNF